MEDTFEIPVLYKNQDLMFTAQLITSGYTHKFKVDVYGHQLFFEQDDSSNYRALVDVSTLEQAKNLDVELLKAIAAAIEFILK